MRPRSRQLFRHILFGSLRLLGGGENAELAKRHLAFQEEHVSMDFIIYLQLCYPNTRHIGAGWGQELFMSQYFSRLPVPN